MEYRVDDRSLSGETFLDFVQQVWPGAYNLEQTRAALSKTMNFTAWDGGQLAGCLRVLTDGCFFGTITELLVLHISGRASEAGCCGWLRPIPPRCCISAPSRGRKRFMRKTAASGACRLI